MTNDDSTIYRSGHVPHHRTDTTATRRFIHPVNPSMMGPFDAMHYNNMMVLADQTRQTHRMLEQLTALVSRRARSVSVSSRTSRTSTAMDDDSDSNGDSNDKEDTEIALPLLSLPKFFTTHKTFFLHEFDRWIKKGHVVRKTRGKTGRTDGDADSFFGDHLEEGESKPDELSEALCNMEQSDKTDFFLMISKSYASANPTAKGTKGVSGKKQKSNAATSSASHTARIANGVDAKNEDQTIFLSDIESTGVGVEVHSDVNDDVDVPCLPLPRGVPARRPKGLVTVQTLTGPRHPASSFSGHEDEEEGETEICGDDPSSTPPRKRQRRRL